MNKVYSLVLGFLNEVLYDESHDHHDHEEKSIIDNVSFQEIYRLVASQGLFSILSNALCKYYKMDQYRIKKESKVIVYRNIFTFMELSALLQYFERKGSSPIIIKGYAISRYYQNPYCRSMCDLDIFVEKADLEKAKNTLCDFGYNQVYNDDYHPMHIQFNKPKRIPIEVHRHLNHDLYLGKRYTRNWYQHIFSHKQLIDFNHLKFYVMSNEDELINQIIHFSSHFIFHGIKLKHLFEIALIVKSSDKLDWEYIEQTLKELEFYRFATLLLSTCATFFHIIVPESMSGVDYKTQEKFMSDLLSYFSKIEGEGVIEGWLSIICNHRIILKKNYLRPMILALSIHSQYKANGFKKLIRNSMNDIKHVRKKLYILKHYQLLNAGSF